MNQIFNVLREDRQFLWRLAAFSLCNQPASRQIAIHGNGYPAGLDNRATWWRAIGSDVCHCSTPDGAFYVYPSIHGCIGKTSKGGVLIKDDEAFALTLLAEEGVATVHGAAFCYPGYIRISYANATEELREAMVRIQRFCQGLH